MYWRSREIYKSECIAANARSTPVVDVSVEDQLDVSMESDDGPVWNEALEFSVETRPSDCVSVNWWDRDPVCKDSGVFTSLGVLIDSVWGASRAKTGRMFC